MPANIVKSNDLFTIIKRLNKDIYFLVHLPVYTFKKNVTYFKIDVFYAL